MSSLKDIAI